MKATVQLDDALLAEARDYAARSGKSLAEVIEDALRQALPRQKAPKPGDGPAQFTTYRGRGLQPGVDLDSSSALLSLMEHGDDPS